MSPPKEEQNLHVTILGISSIVAMFAIIFTSFYFSDARFNYQAKSGSSSTQSIASLSNEKSGNLVGKGTSVLSQNFITKSANQSQLQVSGIGLTPIFSPNISLTQDFPVGQMFDLDVTMLDNSENQNLTINNVKVKIMLNNVLAMVNLLCEKTGSVITCREGLWNAINVALGKNSYRIQVTGKDNVGNTISHTESFFLSFRKVVNISLCKSLLPGYNKRLSNRANIVFVGFGYGNVTGKAPQEALKLIANASIDLNGYNYGLFSVEPFKSNKNKFNFWYVDKLGSVSQCVSPSGECPAQPSFPLAENCIIPNKYIVSFVDNIYAAAGAGGRYATLGAALSPNLPLNKNGIGLLFTHEFGGHTFGKLADEYIIFPNQSPGYETSDSIFAYHKNCYAGPQHTQQECMTNVPWKKMIGNGCGKEGIIDCNSSNKNFDIEIGCFEGCGKYGIGIFRPTRNSIMGMGDSNLYSFGLWNEKLINDELRKLS